VTRDGRILRTEESQWTVKGKESKGKKEEKATPKNPRPSDRNGKPPKKRMSNPLKLPQRKISTLQKHERISLKKRRPDHLSKKTTRRERRGGVREGRQGCQGILLLGKRGSHIFEKIINDGKSVKEGSPVVKKKLGREKGKGRLKRWKQLFALWLPLNQERGQG